MYKLVEPEESAAALDSMVADAEEVCRRLGIAHQVKLQCTGDMGFAVVRTYDVEMWAPGCDEWLEVSSCSNCTDFQARRLNIRYRPEQGAEGDAKGKKKKKAKTEFAHTLNATACAVPRMIVAIFENFQEADGSVRIPEVLWPFMGGVQVIKPVQP